MNYSRNIKKNTIGKRIVASWVVVAVIFSLCGYALAAVTTKKETKTVVYGQYDGVIMEAEMPVEWQENSDFTPLDVPLSEDLQEFTYYLCKAYDMDYTLVMAMIQVESNFQADIISDSGDYGLMQINEINHEYLSETLGISDFTDPYSSIRAGTYILRKLFEKYETPDKVLMAYNMGESGAAKLWAQGVYQTNYTDKVFEARKAFIGGAAQ